MSLAGRADLPIPAWLFGVAAVVVLVVSFAALAALWRTPALEGQEDRARLTLPRWVDPLCGAIGVALFVLVVSAGLAGTPTATENLAPTFVYVAFGVGLVVLSICFGSVFVALSPWRAAARFACWVAARAGWVPRPPRAYPARLGHWPAAAGIAVFAWLQLVYDRGIDPEMLALAALVYAGGQAIGMAWFGVEAWSRRGDPFGVYFDLFARLAPIDFDGRSIAVRRPLSGLTRPRPHPGTAALLCVMIGTTSYDGLRATDLWRRIRPQLEDFAAEHGATSLRQVSHFAPTVGMAAMVALAMLVFATGIAGMRFVTRSERFVPLARRFAHSLVPIAAAYVVAHYLSLLVFQGQSIAALSSDPFGSGRDLFGTASVEVDYGALSATTIWYLQILVVIAGHAAGLALAHDRALVLFGARGTVALSQACMLGAMVGFTCLALWQLAAINI